MAKKKWDLLNIEGRLPEIERWCLEGATDADIYTRLGVGKTTFNNWKKQYPKLFELLKTGKSVADQNVENALYQRAIGYSHQDTKFFQFEGEVITVETIKHYPPDTAAAFIWLKNRGYHSNGQPWRDKHEIEHIDGLTINVTLTDEVDALEDDDKQADG